MHIKKNIYIYREREIEKEIDISLLKSCRWHTKSRSYIQTNYK